MEAEEPPRPSRGAARLQVTLSEDQRLCVTALSLTDPAAAAAGGQPMVRVWAEVGHQELTIGRLWPEQPAAPVPAPVEIGGGQFLLRHDSASSGVRLYGYYVDPDEDHGGEGAPTRRRFVEDIGTGQMADEDEEMREEFEFEPLSDDERYGSYGEDDGNEEEEEVWEELEPPTEEYLAELYDSDNGEYDDGEEDEEEYQPRKSRTGEGAGETSKRRKSFPLFAAPAAIVVPDGVLLGPARFAAVRNTAGFMKVAAAEDGTAASQGGKEIVVLYRYTRFSRTWSGRRGVEACRRTKLHWLRFAAPPAGGDWASSLAWAGSSLSPLIYPGLFRRELRDLWSSLAAAPAIADSIPPQATRLQVVVDVGILRREDHTAERMEHMRGALEAIMGEAWPEFYHVGMELHLPEPVRREDGGGGDEDGSRPAKRRRVADDEEEEECSLCLDPLESGLAAWPGCGHEFHGECVEKTLARSEACPLCRRKLSDALVICNAIQSS